jgi:hypothetical protein
MDGSFSKSMIWKETATMPLCIKGDTETFRACIKSYWHGTWRFSDVDEVLDNVDSPGDIDDDAQSTVCFYIVILVLLLTPFLCDFGKSLLAQKPMSLTVVLIFVYQGNHVD